MSIMPPYIQACTYGAPEWEYRIEEADFATKESVVQWLDQLGRARWEAVNVEWREFTQRGDFRCRVLLKRPNWHDEVRVVEPSDDSRTLAESIEEQMDHMRFASWANTE